MSVLARHSSHKLRHFPCIPQVLAEGEGHRVGTHKCPYQHGTHPTNFAILVRIPQVLAAGEGHRAGTHNRSPSQLAKGRGTTQASP